MHCKNKNFVPDFVLPSRILYYANIAKGECIAKTKTLFLILYCRAASYIMQI